MSEFLARHKNKLIATGAALTAVGVGAVTYAEYANPTKSLPADSCTSPIEEFGPFAVPGTSKLRFEMGLTRTTILEAKIPENQGVLGVQASFRNVDNQPKVPPITEEQLQRSPMVPRTAGKVALKFSQGDGWTMFGISYVAKKGSPACLAKPSATMREVSSAEAVFSRGNQPWHNILRTLTGLGGQR